MLRRSKISLSSSSTSLVATAIQALSRLEDEQQLQTEISLDSSRLNASGTHQYGLKSTTSSRAPWIDRDNEKARALDEHRQSEVYKELHRRPTSNSELGMYGGEPGFNITPRVWVDPDNPHVKNVYNKAPLSVNMRWARYGHFKNEMHIIDVDKLCRHARNLPACDLLLTDFMSARAALDDDGGSALVRHGARALNSLIGTSHAESYFERIQSVFERFLIAISPPMYAGIRTHADMIRVCTLMKDYNKWDEGWFQYRQRAVDEAEDAKSRREQLMMRRNRMKSYNKNNMMSGTKKNNDDAYDYNERKNRPILLDKDATNDRFESQEDHRVIEIDNEVNTDEGALMDPMSTAILDATSAADQAALRAHSSHFFELDSDFYDAVIELCVAYEKYDECIDQLNELIASGHRPRISSLSNGFLAAAHLKNTTVGDDIPRLVELYKLSPTVPYFQARAAYAAMVRPEQTWNNFLESISTPIVDHGHILKAGVAGLRTAAHVTEVADHNQWSEATEGRFSLSSSKSSYRELLQGKAAMPTNKTVSWSLLGLAMNPECKNANEVLKMLDLAMSKGIAIDYEQMTFALDFVVKKMEQNSINSPREYFSLIQTIIRERVPSLGINVTPEMALIAMRGLAQLISTSNDDEIDNNDNNNNNDEIIMRRRHLPPSVASATSINAACCSLALHIMSSLEQSNNRSSSHFPSIFFELCQLLARCGAMGAFTSTLRTHVLARGETVHPWLIRSWLWCNSNADEPNGNHVHVTSEAIQFMMMSGGGGGGGGNNNGINKQLDEEEDDDQMVTREFVTSLILCRMKHGVFPESIKTVLDRIVFDVVAPSTTDDETGQSGDHEKSLLETVEFFANFFSSSSSSASSTGLNHQQNSSNDKTEMNNNKNDTTTTSPLSLEESLDLALGEEEEEKEGSSNSNSNSNNSASSSSISTESNRVANQTLRRELVEQCRQNLFASLGIADGNNIINNSSQQQKQYRTSVYDACTQIADDTLYYADAISRLQEEESSWADSDNKNKNDNDELIIVFAQLLAGLPSEKDESSNVAKITKSFNPTPSDLRDLRTKWTFDCYDVQLRRNGQKGGQIAYPDKILPYALQVQPFNENL